ncbi:MAG: EAL domain-containing protein [Actinomycetota bacterium]|nr:EAL domain-containing protein [Actinomycetota bacterium]
MSWWRTFLVAGIAAVVVGAAFGGLAQAIVGELLGMCAVAAVLAGVRRWRPAAPAAWWLFAAGGSSFLAGNLVRVVHGFVVGVVAPFPSPADALFFVGYALLIGGEVVLVRRRSADLEGDNLIDALIAATAIGVVMAAYVIVPYADQPAVGPLPTLINIGYSAADLVMVALAVRLAVGSGRRVPSYYLLAGSVAAVIAADVVTTLQTAGQAGPSVPGAFSAACFVLFGAAALHPSMAQLTEAPDHREIELTRRRLVLLCTALLMVPGLLAVELALGGRASVPALAAGSVALAVLVLGRLAGLVRAKERKAGRERVLHDAGALLVAATTTSELYDGAATALASLAEGGGRTRASVTAGEADSLVVAAARGHRSEEAVGFRIAVEALPTAARTALLERQPASVALTNPVDLPERPGDERPSLLLVPLWSRGQLRGSFLVTTERRLGLEATMAIQALADLLSLALASAALTEEFHRGRHERRFRALIEHSSDLVSVIAPDGLVSFASPASLRLLGLPAEALVGQPPLQRIHPDDRHRAAGLLDMAWAGSGPAEPVEARVRHHDGAWRWFELVADNLLEEPTVEGLVIHARDVTDRKAAELQVANSEARFRSLVQHASDLVMVVDELMCIAYLSPSVNRMLGYTVGELAGTSGLDLVHPDDTVAAARLIQRCSTDLTPPSMELRLRHADRSWRTLDFTMSDLRHEPAVAGIVLNARDVTERKTLESDLRHQALHDDLTGLANRTLFADRVGHALDRRRGGPDHVAVLFIDLDDFKTVNDGLGHVAGDSLLVAVASRLRDGLRDEDTAARLGGDEFAVLLERMADASEVLDVADRLLVALGEPYRVDGHALHVGASIGIVIDEDRTATAATLLRDADVAMYLAKSRGKGGYEVFEHGMHAIVFERLELKGDLARGVERDEFRLLYQPIVDLTTGAWTEAEALVRWHHPARGVMAPDLFIPLAEETGLIVPIGNQVLQEACTQMRRWRHQEQPLDVSLSVNLSVRQLAHPGLVAQVANALERSGTDPRSLTLEITESLLMVDLDGNYLRLAELKELGVRLALDDFGTGYSSLGYLQRFPVDVLKIDRSLIDPLGRRRQQVDVVRAVIDLAHSQGLKTVAEGVERGEQLAVLQSLGCDAAQGFHFSRPVPSDVVEGLVREHLGGPTRPVPGALRPRRVQFGPA